MTSTSHLQLVSCQVTTLLVNWQSGDLSIILILICFLIGGGMLLDASAKSGPKFTPFRLSENGSSRLSPC